MRSLGFVLGVLIANGTLAQTPSLTELCDLPSSVTETSGLENGPNDWFWTHNDSGNPAELFCVDTNGVIQRTVSVMGDPNTDWEELAKDDQGNLYIGNFGNNSLNRTDLRIVKIPSIDTCTATAQVSDTIRFSYPDQYSFPPNGNYGNFDMEAMVWYQDSLHLFSKDRSNPGTGYTKHYRLPQDGGTYVAHPVDSFQTTAISYIFSVTAADITENGRHLALLSANKIWLFTDYSGTDFFQGTASEISLSVFSQKEGICFRDGLLYITDEASFNLGGKMYRLDPGLFVGLEELIADHEVTPVYGNDLRLQHIVFPNSEPIGWQLFSTDGRLLYAGTAVGSIESTEFHGLQGMHVIRVANGIGVKAVLIRL